MNGQEQIAEESPAVNRARKWEASQGKNKIHRKLIPVKVVFPLEPPNKWGEPRIQTEMKKIKTHPGIGVTLWLDDERREIVVNIDPIGPYISRPAREICIPVSSTSGYEAV